MSLLLLGCAGKMASGPSGNEELGGLSSREVQVRLDLADAYLRNDEPRMSLRELLRIQRAASGSPRFQFTLGYTQFVLENWPAAVEALERTVALDPGHAEGWNNLGLAHLAQDDFSAAELAFHRALEIPTYQTPEIAALNLALLHLEQGDPVAARRYADRAMELNWRFGRAYLLAAEVEVGRGNLDAAVDLLRRGVEADTANVRMVLTLAEYLLLAGRDQDAEKWLLLVIEAAPDGPDAKTAEGYLRSLGRVADHGFEEGGGQEGGGAEKSDPAMELTTSRASPAPTPASPSTIPPETLADSMYIVQVGGFLDPRKAEALRDGYAAKGYPAGTVEVTHSDRQWVLVYIDAFPDLKAAQHRAREFLSRESVDAVVTRVGMGRYLPLDSP
ncbi:SPOR domain-containing protein [Desulfonatronum thiodismutans]|uniref:SPOR domain-containing protein n=1 Tax=Desulfonatronum thiodismutans TaxID=159290 RepID=UPI00126899C8|nr:SPOR domain-containing protein [Desulfonatronum thiodismutans]